MTAPTGNTNRSSLFERRRRAWRWLQLLWVGFLFFPAFELLGKPRPWPEYAFGMLVLLSFVAVFIWVFFVAPWLSETPSRAFRVPSMIGVGASYAAMAMLWPLVGANGIGLLIYAGSFSGAQRSAWPAAFTVTASAIVCLGLWSRGEINWLTAAMMVFFTLMSAVLNNQAYHEALSRRALARSQEEVARIAAVAERERIARDLHDLLGHTLSVIVLKSELASRLAEKNPARAAEEIREVERIARQSLQEVRSAVRGYRSTGLEGELANASLALEAAQVKLEQYVQPVELEWACEQSLAFCLRESVTNVIRHARARRCWINLEKRAGMVLLEVWDDGGGTITVGNGVRGMRERAEALGGTLETTTSAGYAGISVRVPLTAPEARAAAAGLGLESS